MTIYEKLLIKNVFAGFGVYSRIKYGMANAFVVLKFIKLFYQVFAVSITFRLLRRTKKAGFD